MKANFESFNRRMLALRDQPRLTVLKRGTISLIWASFRALGSPDAVELLYDRERTVVGLRQIEHRAVNAHYVRQPASSPRGPWLISAMAFARFYGIDTTVTTRCQAYLDGDVLCADLSTNHTQPH